MKDLKEALGNSRKPDITHVRKSIMVYIARACEYGSAKYERGNYLRPTENGTLKSDFLRFRAYLRAALSHIVETLDSMEFLEAHDPKLESDSDMSAAAYAPDTDASPAFPASGLPHVAHAAASLMMAIEQATLWNLLPEDPEQPWVKKLKEEE